MPDAFHAEFTGERVIPGRVEENLFNEHLARYRFAIRLVRELGIAGTFLDAGCGAGYGSAELARSGEQVVGIDVSPEAIEHARSNYAGENLRFEQASCTAIPGGGGAFHLITAFEVIEHLPDWRNFLQEARRVLHPGGMFLVSTPNRLYYAESRQRAGPNPFHVHEFTVEEFRFELAAIFPHVKVLLQNHVEGIALSGADAEGLALEISERNSDPSSAHFFLALCALEPLPAIPRFLFIPETGNVLQTRERHIALLDGEIRQKNQWIEQEKAANARMNEKVRELEFEMEEHTRWARLANEEADRRARLVSELQEELSKSNEWARARDTEAVERGQRVVELQQELERSNTWAQARDAEAVERSRRVEELQEEVAKATAWAQMRDVEVIQLQEELTVATDWARSLDAKLVKREQQQQEIAAVYEAAIEQWRRDKDASDQWAMETERRLSAERDSAREAFQGKQLEYENALQRIAALQADLEQLRAQMNDANARMEMIAQSRWVRLGRSFRVGPELGRT